MEITDNYNGEGEKVSYFENENSVVENFVENPLMCQCSCRNNKSEWLLWLSPVANIVTAVVSYDAMVKVVRFYSEYHFRDPKDSWYLDLYKDMAVKITIGIAGTYVCYWLVKKTSHWVKPFITSQWKFQWPIEKI